LPMTIVRWLLVLREKGVRPKRERITVKTEGKKTLTSCFRRRWEKGRKKERNKGKGCRGGGLYCLWASNGAKKDEIHEGKKTRGNVNIWVPRIQSKKKEDYRLRFPITYDVEECRSQGLQSRLPEVSPSSRERLEPPA